MQPPLGSGPTSAATFDMFVEPDAAAGLGHANRNLGSFTAILLGPPCHCRRTHTGTNGNSRPSSPRRIGAPPCHICLAFASDRGVSRPLTQVSARGRRRRQARPTFFASESIPCNAASRLVVPVISRSGIIDNSLVVGGISPATLSTLKNSIARRLTTCDNAFSSSGR
jgi:hypothetical protein